MLKIYAIIRHNLKGVETMKNRNFFAISATLGMIAALFLGMAYILFHTTWLMYSLIACVAMGVGGWLMVEKIDKENVNPEIEKFCKMMMGC